MAGFMIPIFESGCVLTEEMLERSKSYAVDLGNLTYAGYANGIVSGCEVTMSDNILYVHKGILIFEQNLYFITETLHIMVNPGSQWQVLRFRVGNMTRNDNYMIGDIQLELSADLQENPNKIEICRFRLQNGAMLRNQYRDFRDLNTEFDTVNVIYAQWSAYEKTTISNRVLKEFAKEASKKGVQNLQDISFVQQILSLDGKSMNRDAIQFYLSTRLQRPYKEMTQGEIYRSLQEVLQTTNQPGMERSVTAPRTERRIIVD